MSEVIWLENVSRIYRMEDVEVPALNGVTLSVREGESLAVMGPSGSGKTTLLNILGCLDRPTAGRYLLQGREVSALADDELSRVRGRYLGFVFQSFQLIAQLTVLENIGLPLFYQGVPDAEMYKQALEMARMVGLGERIHHRPSELSGGQQQRVAIARALVNHPAILLADEPTGNLDSKTGKEIMQLLIEMNRKGKTLLLITHDAAIAGYAERTVRLLDGRIEDAG